MATNIKWGLRTVRIPFYTCLIHSLTEMAHFSSLLKTVSLFSPDNLSSSLYVKIRLSLQRPSYHQSNHPICICTQIPCFTSQYNGKKWLCSYLKHPRHLFDAICYYLRRFILHLSCLLWFFWFNTKSHKQNNPHKK